MKDRQLGVINEQGYYGSGFGFTEVTKEEQDKLERDRKDRDDNNKPRK